ncbi:DUF3558 domain-containing protein [Actinokineospora sp. UTMC 2448]|uniref:DUF3558 domain-containing protein n=1 Tax=Actinokineospora sp. UTMC 2448 TaxID=2268449 RepID=UPI002164DA8E|nr:DUF3558 domain-containing protein [Actinokineospora sp. UTMC 2448]
MTARLAACALALFIAGCTTSDTTAPPPTITESTTPPSIPIAGDVAQFLDRACELLPAEQATEFGLSGAPVQTRSGDRGLCIWEGDIRLGVQVRPTGDPLADAYRRRNTWQVFTPTAIVGQPAAIITTSEPGTGCVIVVGTAPGQGLDLDLSTTRIDAGWCLHLERIAEAMIKQLRR